MLFSEIKEIQKCIQNKKLKEFIDFNSIDGKNKGGIGQLFETQIFNKELDNKNTPDLEVYVDLYETQLINEINKDIKMELKVTAAKQLKNGEYRAKERLVLSKINYFADYPIKFNDSELYQKIRYMLIIYYLYDKDTSLEDYSILISFINNLDNLDLSIIELDYKTIVSKIKKGEAHLISGSDTFFLEACTKGGSGSETAKQPFSCELAKPRAFALKNSFMSTLLKGALNGVIQEKHNEANDLVYIEKKLNLIVGKTYEELKEAYAPGIKKNKSEKAIVFRNYLGISSNSLNELGLFKKANVKFKTFNISNTLLPSDGVNYITINWNDYDSDEWEDCKLFEVVNTKYLYCYFHKNKDTKQLTFAGYCFHGFTEDEIEMARLDWENAKKLYYSGKKVDENLLKSGESNLFYIRTKGNTLESSIKAYSNKQKIKGLAWWVRSDWARTNIIIPSVKLDLSKKM